MLLYFIESGAAHHFLDGKVIQRNFVKSYTPIQGISLQVHLKGYKYILFKRIPKLGAHSRNAYNGGAPPPPLIPDRLISYELSLEFRL